MVEVKKTSDSSAENKKAAEKAMPPLEAAARRLERLLSEQVLDFYTNPVKVVRRWLGTSSGAAAGATSAVDISSAVATLLDPATSSAPFVATLVDVTGLIIYFIVAAMILKL